MTSSMSPAKPFPFRLFGLLFTLGLLFMTGFGAFVSWRSTATDKWPVVEGRVVESLVESKRERKSSGSGTKQRYTPRVTYTYSVSGREFTSDRIGVVTTSYGSRSKADAISSRYPKGGTIQVHHDPKDPSSAYLETGFNVTGGVIFAIGLIGLGIVRAIRRATA